MRNIGTYLILTLLLASLSTAYATDFTKEMKFNNKKNNDCEKLLNNDLDDFDSFHTIYTVRKLNPILQENGIDTIKIKSCEVIEKDKGAFDTGTLKVTFNFLGETEKCKSPYVKFINAKLEGKDDAYFYRLDESRGEHLAEAAYEILTGLGMQTLSWNVQPFILRAVGIGIPSCMLE